MYIYIYNQHVCMLQICHIMFNVLDSVLEGAGGLIVTYLHACTMMVDSKSPKPSTKNVLSPTQVQSISSPS